MIAKPPRLVNLASAMPHLPKVSQGLWLFGFSKAAVRGPSCHSAVPQHAESW